MSPAVRVQLLRLTDTSELGGIDDARARIAAIATLFAEGDDRRGLFPVVYRVITDKACDSVRSGQYQDDLWARQLIVRFAKRYLDNLNHHLAGRNVTGPWAQYYGVATAPRGSSLHVLALGIAAHLVDDLPRTLAEIGSSERHHADFQRFGEILIEAFDDLVTATRDAYEVDPEPMLRGFFLGRGIDAVKGDGTVTAWLFRAIRTKAWLMGQRMQQPGRDVEARFEIGTSFATMAGVLRHLAATQVI